MVLLVCGDPQTGKKAIVKNWWSKIEHQVENKSFYKVYSFSYDVALDSVNQPSQNTNQNQTGSNAKLSIPCEIRILNSDEMETEWKINSVFFSGALGAFVTTAIDDEVSFQDGAKWKEKLDLMCCLPNKFPLPIFLVVNKCENFNFENPEHSFQEKGELEKYTWENQFFNASYIGGNGDNTTNLDCNTKIDEVQSNGNWSENGHPLKELINTVLKFKDIRDKFGNWNTGVKGGNQVEDTDGTVVIMDKNKKKNCVIF